MLFVLADGLIALLCCIGIASIIAFFCVPKRRAEVFTAGLIVASDAERACAWIRPMRAMAGQTLLVGYFGDMARQIELCHRNTTVLTPEEFSEYIMSKITMGEEHGQGANQN